MLGDLKKKKKRKKKKKKSVPKQMSWRDYSKNPQPYEIPLYMPPYPSVINIQKNQPNVQRIVADALRNYQDINTVELERLRGDLTAYRIESQTNFKQKVLAPKRGPNEQRFLSFKENLRRDEDQRKLNDSQIASKPIPPPLPPLPSFISSSGQREKMDMIKERGYESPPVDLGAVSDFSKKLSNIRNPNYMSDLTESGEDIDYGSQPLPLSDLTLPSSEPPPISQRQELQDILNEQIEKIEDVDKREKIKKDKARSKFKEELKEEDKVELEEIQEEKIKERKERKKRQSNKKTKKELISELGDKGIYGLTALNQKDLRARALDNGISIDKQPPPPPPENPPPTFSEKYPDLYRKYSNPELAGFNNTTLD